MSIELHFDHGTLVVPSLPQGDQRLTELLTHDPRTGVWRAPAHRYRDLATYLHRSGLAYQDHARRFEPLALSLRQPVQPFPHQKDALRAWIAAGCRGVVELPTGS